MYKILSLRDNTSFKNPLAIALPTILQALQNLFAGADPGHWEGSRFIPGDLNNRLAWCASRIDQYGVASVVDQNHIYDLLTTPGDWNGAIDNYLGTLRTGLQNGTIIPGQINSPLINPQTGAPNTTGGGFVYNFSTFGNLLPPLALGAGLWYLLAHKKKSKKRRR